MRFMKKLVSQDFRILIENQVIVISNVEKLVLKITTPFKFLRLKEKIKKNAILN